MTKDEEWIWEAPVRNAIETGIEYESMLPGCVPEFEEREAAVYCHYTPRQFRRLDVWERACCVAQYRLRRMVDNQVEAAIGEAVKRMAQQRGKGGD